MEVSQVLGSKRVCIMGVAGVAMRRLPEVATMRT
jgi:hypothetical protein